ncbi:MAG: D-aminoacyl-tRNA deacylase [Candidatus Izemoplasmatales bacterium]|nr:D-aminoacyl-tRNA deacylase [Candidatus Izemoplasmatales bacterium]
MKVVVQRVSKANVTVNGKIVSAIDRGYLLLVGFKRTDTEKTIDYLARKVARLRVFEDSSGLMNLSLDEVQGSILSISQFTIYGDVIKSNRPSFTEAMDFETANAFYLKFNELLRNEYGFVVKEGVFGENMQVSLINDGPVTIIIEKD